MDWVKSRDRTEGFIENGGSVGACDINKQSMYTILVQGEEDVNSNMPYPLTNFEKQKDTPKTRVMREKHGNFKSPN